MVFVLVSRSRRVVPDELVTLTSWDAALYTRQISLILHLNCEFLNSSIKTRNHLRLSPCC